MRNCDRQRTCDNKGISSIHTFRTPFRSEIGSLYCGSIFDPPSKRKIPANLTACGDFWSWQCDSNTRPADYEPDSGLKTKTKQAFSGFSQRLNHQVGLVSRMLPRVYFPYGSEATSVERNIGRNLRNSKQR